MDVIVAQQKKLTHEQFLKELGEDCLNEFEILSEYISIDKKILFKHKKCDTRFEISPYAFISKHNKKYCPICYYKKSHGEIIISSFLTKHQIEFQREFTFPDFKLRRFDFYLPELNIVIEYDGIQYFESINFFGGEESFKQTKKRDEEKNQYCKSKNIQLFRLPYNEIDNLNQILYEILKEKSSTTIEKFLIN